MLRLYFFFFIFTLCTRFYFQPYGLSLGFYLSSSPLIIPFPIWPAIECCDDANMYKQRERRAKCYFWGEMVHTRS
ncbi:hypothetical protein DFP73DRAFT_570407 [Morchella snyderi]|nr:hypothetical protein DFP73DRAFT_570407 [Morchella snyderi]